MMNDDLLSIIDGGEASKVEFKSSLQRDTKTQTKNEELIYEVIKTICAFLNTDGGILLIGVTDYGEIVGLESDYELFKIKKNKDQFLIHLNNCLTNYGIDERFKHYLKINMCNIEGKEICTIHVTNSNKDNKRCVIKKDKFHIRELTSSPCLTLEKTVSYIETYTHKYLKGDSISENNIDIVFKETESKEMIIKKLSNLTLPSELKIKEIKDIIQKKKKEVEDKKILNDNSLHRALHGQLSSLNAFKELNLKIQYPFGNVPYEERNLEDLEKLLFNLESEKVLSNNFNKYNDDLYKIYEELGGKLNFCILNNDNVFLEDINIELQIEDKEGLFLADKIYLESQSGSELMIPLSGKHSRGYPYVNKTKLGRKVSENLKVARHGYSTDIFDDPIRLAIMPNFSEELIKLKFVINAKNSKTNIEKILTLRVQ